MSEVEGQVEGRHAILRKKTIVDALYDQCQDLDEEQGPLPIQPEQQSLGVGLVGLRTRKIELEGTRML